MQRIILPSHERVQLAKAKIAAGMYDDETVFGIAERKAARAATQSTRQPPQGLSPEPLARIGPAGYEDEIGEEDGATVVFIGCFCVVLCLCGLAYGLVRWVVA